MYSLCRSNHEAPQRFPRAEITLGAPASFQLPGFFPAFRLGP